MGALISGATTTTSAPAASRPSTLRAATAPPPTTTQLRPAKTRFTGYRTSAIGMALPPGCGDQAKRLPLPVEAEDLQLDPEVHLAQGHLRGDAHRRGSK